MLLNLPNHYLFSHLYKYFFAQKIQFSVSCFLQSPVLGKNKGSHVLYLANVRQKLGRPIDQIIIIAEELSEFAQCMTLDSRWPLLIFWPQGQRSRSRSYTYQNCYRSLFYIYSRRCFIFQKMNDFYQSITSLILRLQCWRSLTRNKRRLCIISLYY